MVMGLDHLYVEILVQSGGHLFGQLHQQVDPEAHVAGPHDGRVARGRFKLCDLIVRHAGGADDMGGTGLRCGMGQGDGCLGCREVNDSAGF